MLYAYKPTKCFQKANYTLYITSEFQLNECDLEFDPKRKVPQWIAQNGVHPDIVFSVFSIYDWDNENSKRRKMCLALVDRSMNFVGFKNSHPVSLSLFLPLFF